MFSKFKKATDEQKRHLAFSSILFTQNGVSYDTLGVKLNKKVVSESLKEWWGIEDTGEALETVQYLSSAKGHTLFADDVYRVFIKNGQRPPITPKGLVNIAGLENAFRATCKRLLSEEYSAMKPALVEEAITEILSREADWEVVAECFFERLTEGLDVFNECKDVLLQLGYQERELYEINSTAAWDYGRAGFIARWSFVSGYLRENDAWLYIKNAADNALKIYSSWREYIAAYIFGRALGYGNNSLELYPVLFFLLNDSDSPINNIPFR